MIGGSVRLNMRLGRSTLRKAMPAQSDGSQIEEGRLIIRIADRITDQNGKEALNPSLLASGSQGEKMARVRSGKLVNSPELINPKPAAMSDKTKPEACSNVRKTIPSIMMPGMNNVECVFHKSLRQKFSSLYRSSINWSISTNEG